MESTRMNFDWEDGLVVNLPHRTDDGKPACQYENGWVEINGYRVRVKFYTRLCRWCEQRLDKNEVLMSLSGEVFRDVPIEWGTDSQGGTDVREIHGAS